MRVLEVDHKNIVRYKEAHGTETKLQFFSV
jgi:hypothetical protein